MAIVALESNSVRTSPDDWRALVKSAIRDSNELRRRLRLPPELPIEVPAELPPDLQSNDLPGSSDSPVSSIATAQAEQQFGTFVPEPFLGRIVPGNPNDPLLLQVLPSADESIQVPGYSVDAVGDMAATRNPGLIHKYQGRALLITRGVCAVHCRYCFRRHFPYQAAPVSIQQFDQALQTIREDASVEELILSGGDPLMMVDDQFLQLVEMIESIPHLRRLRIHTRLPIVIPQRVTAELQSILKRTRLTTVVVIHVNHPNEIDDAVEEAVRKLNDCHLTMLNQSVLLKGVNDNLVALVELSKRLINMNCVPYYLHQLDRVQGAAHFEVDPVFGRQLIEEMRKVLPGYAVPKYVQEIAGQASKTEVTV